MQNLISSRTSLFALSVITILALAGCSNSAPPPQVDEAVAAENLAKGKAFLAENAGKEGIESLESGVQYKVVTSNPNGRTPKLIDSVHINLRMTHLDGTVISDSFAAGKPETVYIKHAIGAWREVLTRMSVGSKWIVYAPPHMAFSSRGNGNIGPNETLICEIELLDIIW